MQVEQVLNLPRTMAEPESQVSQRIRLRLVCTEDELLSLRCGLRLERDTVTDQQLCSGWVSFMLHSSPRTASFSSETVIDRERLQSEASHARVHSGQPG